MAKKTEEVVPSAKNPVVGSLIKSMFDSSEEDPDEKAENLKAAKESADADAEARKPADDILDEGGANDDEPEPPKRAAKPEPKPEPKAEPAAEPADDEPADEPEKRMVPLGELIDLRMERKQLQDRVKAQEEELKKLKAEPPKPKPVDDPEPPKDKILEHDEWEKRELRRQIAASNERIEEVTKKLSERDQIEQLRDMEERFDVMLEEEHGKYAAKNPEFTEKREFLRERLIKQATARGATEAQAKQMVKAQEREFCGLCVNQGLNFSKEIEKQADAAGYEYYKTWKATQKPAGGNGNGKPAGQSPADKIKAGQKREAASKSTGTAPAAPPAPSEDDVMTAEKFTSYTPAQRRAYKKAHPDFELGKIMGGGESNEGLF